jgi:hypothetical protein
MPSSSSSPTPARICASCLIIVAASTLCAAADDSPPLVVIAERDSDRLEVTVENDEATVSVYSPSGIGGAVIERASEQWPEAVVLRLHLTGLESLSLASGEMKLAASVSSQDLTVRLWKDGDERAPLDDTSPLWMAIRILDGDGQPAKKLPLRDGCFEMRLPKALFDGNPQSITVSWIDFYRG